MNHRIEHFAPFGIIVHNTSEPDSVAQFDAATILSWVRNHKIVVFRGYTVLPKQELALFAQQLGKPLQWAFGAINDLKVKPDTENYIFTDHEVPMHWDGAFVGTIPHVILFQCIQAPRKEDMGGTTFCNTEQLLSDLPEETRRNWERISITYTTKKIVHYGGKITQQLIAYHEVEPTKKVIRYAEPVEDLNPVSLNISGLQQKTPEAFIAEMKQLIYHPDYLYTHRWETGDTVMADNHTLLHGREAFLNPNERYIQRINLLHRPEKKSLARTLNNWLTIRRKEFFVAELPIFLIALLLSITSWNDFASPTLYMGLIAIILLFNCGDMINCYADYEQDSVFKSHLSNAVFELGKRNVLLQIIISASLALLLTIAVALMTHNYYLIPLTVGGTFLGLEYSIKPFKFKSRGFMQLICLWGIIFFGPMLYTSIITSGFPSLPQLLIFTFFGLHQMGIILLNTAEDYTEDKLNGLRTIVGRYDLVDL
ncbi:MAG: TauD/TfdA family dioxygenase [Flavobacteriia bacterium]|nr:TauD/TfdA family dioxygenase [Flavobacteriia bacterium]